MSSAIELQHDGIPTKVTTPIECRKTVTGKYVLRCRCDTEDIELGNKWQEPTNPSQGYILPLESVKNAKRRAETINAAPRDNLIKFLREFSKAEKIEQMGASDEEIFSFDLIGDICHQVYHCTTTMTNPVTIEKPITLREAIKTIPIKRDGFTLKALARIAAPQNLTPEQYIDNVEKLLADAAKIGAYLKRVQDLATEGKTTFQSGRMAEFLSILESDLATVPDRLKREMEREIDQKIREMLEASFVQFEPGEETLPEKIKSAFKNHNEATLLVAEK
jgi:hypothetical protein